MTQLLSLFIISWLGLGYGEGDNWRMVYLMMRPRVVMVRCGMLQGAGFIYRDRRHVVSSLHVAGCGRKITVSHPDIPQPVVVKLKAYISRHDLALLELDTAWPEPPLVPAHAEWAAIGQQMAVIGHPYHPSGPLEDRLRNPMSWSLSLGVLGRVTSEYLQVLFPRIDGFSGAPLLDRHGRLLGMLTQIGTRDKPIGMVARVSVIEQLFAPKSPRQGMPYLGFELRFTSRFSFALGDASRTIISPSTQEIRLDLVFWDQLNVGVFAGLGLLTTDLGLQLSILPGVVAEYRFLMPRVTRPYLDYITLGGGVMFSFFSIDTSGVETKEGTLFQKIVFKPEFRTSLSLGIGFVTLIGRFSVGLFLDPTNLSNPVLSVGWGI
jgi:hypothetical protein